jgi:cytidylate kinase
MAVITISREFGSNGDEIAHAIASKLKLELVDRHSVEQFLARYGVDESQIQRYDEKKPGVWDLFSTGKERYAHYVRLAVFDVARSGRAVVLGRGAQMILGDVPGVLHVRVVAPLEVRVERIVEHFSASETQARRMIHHNDHDRAGFHRAFHDCNWDDVRLYDMIINTGRLTPGLGVDLIAAAYSQLEKSVQVQDTHAVLEDLFLAQEVIGRIRFSEGILVRFLDVRALRGVVTVTGVVSSEALIQRCTDVASSVQGVTKVVTDLQLVPEYTEMLV